MDGKAFLDVAKRLVAGSTEAEWRTAAGRAYYALMLEALAALQRWGFVAPRRDSVHAFVRLRFLYNTDPDLRAIGVKLERLGRLRNDADYQVSQSGPFASPVVATGAIRDAEDALTRLDQIDGDPARRAAAIRMIRAAWP